MVKILLVEDDPGLGMVIKDNLEQENYSVSLATNGDDALVKYHDESYDICLLDVMLPKKDGFAVAQEIRKQDRETPILFITAKSMVEDRLKGFTSGGDDYITKPFNMKELIFRMEVFLKRSKKSTSTNSEIYSIGRSSFNFSTYTLDTPINSYSLTSKEANVMLHLLRNKNKVVKRNDILKAIWGSEDYFLGRSMDVYISKLRKYLKDDSTATISTVHGVGFKLEDQTLST